MHNANLNILFKHGRFRHFTESSIWSCLQTHGEQGTIQISEIHNRNPSCAIDLKDQGVQLLNNRK